MPTEIKFYHVKFVDLQTGKFYEQEVSGDKLQMILNDSSIQIIEKQYLRTKKLTGSR